MVAVAETVDCECRFEVTVSAGEIWYAWCAEVDESVGEICV